MYDIMEDKQTNLVRTIFKLYLQNLCFTHYIEMLYAETAPASSTFL